MSLMSALEQYTSFDFEGDLQYKKGLEAILSKRDESNPDAQAMSAIVRQAKVFYFNHVTGNNITAEEVQAYEKARPAESSAEKRILTFAELQQLIEAGKLDEIPNNKHIPDGLNATKPTTARLTPQKKPWEATQ